MGRCLVLNGSRKISLHSGTLGRRGKAVCHTQTVLPSKSPPQDWAGVTQSCCTFGPRCPRSGTQHTQLRQAEVSPKKGVLGTISSGAVGLLIQEVVGARIYDGTGDGAGSWKRDTSRHMNIVTLHLAWEIILSLSVGHSVGSGTFEVCADQRWQHATLGSSFISTPSHRLSR